MMKIDILTLFPEMFNGPFSESILKRAQEKGIVEICIINIRDFALDKHKVTDDYPFGGGAGMVMKPEPVFGAIRHLKGRAESEGRSGPRVILMSPQGRRFCQAIAREIATYPYIVIIAGHYEGVDERIRQCLADDEISIGDYVLTGGELPAMVLVDAVVRLLPGAISQESVISESFCDGLLEYPQYTRPREFEGMKVPEILLSGDHEKIRLWRRKESLRRTLLRRPDLIDFGSLTAEDRMLIREVAQEEGLSLGEEGTI
ncbi:MAG TPA: tRNA (guanosine(37)-N1)-methyltransferase TrmD [Firmicutes bacterium]|nr:tRNA (guanosine(37)-N1)-methyltransferase TrmD [Bacillota bacterium]